MLHLPQLRLLAAAALADGVLHEQERERLYALARLLDIPKETVREELTKMVGRQAVLCPPSEKQERQAFFGHVVLMVLADGVVHDKEREFLYRIGPTFGFDASAVDQKLAELKAAPPPELPAEEAEDQGLLRRLLLLVRGGSESA